MNTQNQNKQQRVGWDMKPQFTYGENRIGFFGRWSFLQEDGYRTRYTVTGLYRVTPEDAIEDARKAFTDFLLENGVS